KFEYEFSIEDSIGTEKLKSVAEFQWPQFPDDTKKLNMDCRAYREEKRCSIEITFSTKEDNTKVAIRFDGSSAREVTIGITNHLIAILKNYETGHGWLHPSFGLSGVLWFASTASMATSVLPIFPGWLRILLVLPMLIFLGCAPFSYLLPYSVFETKKN